ncbi:hypothetical protein P175DRAFT_0501086 [Aspergillus ochraceoroseus IBT 24754]|uniref:NIMA-interacting protein TinC n=1 Tax=Aspergillus ochraceoroseus IBT 24754 TaxID=1392256 RepID=A0A2T5M120_9EURO|nr:uncharacterized protein P175DRAFT_0501086 [Aspergillus ochraceoroseus IBT 24754]PTU22228.1 hypothetical protein P175DRAFT_0501086 [Aspergillus ochraceoroseus IBT 24754]
MGTSFPNLCFLLFLFIFFSEKVHAFGAGNIASISRIEGQNWRHGDIEDTLLTLLMARVAGGRKFSKLDVQRVYFGNWLRDYSQAVDIGTVKYVSAEAIRILLWVLGFLSFGYGTKEFEVTTERLGCYQPTEHIDNPLGYGEGEDAREYDSRLRGPIDEERELAIDPRTGLKNYIANECIDIATSADLVRRMFRRSVQLGRQYARSGNDEDLHEALRLLGTGLHCLEDYAAHSNYIELSLIELGESSVFPHVGRDTQVEIDGASGPVYPLVTGTFGGVDFFHSVLGEISDKATQSEIQSLEGVINDSQNDSPSQSLLQGLLSKIPDGLIGDSDDKVSKMDELKAQSENAKVESEHVSPREPEEWTRYLNDVQKQIYPILEWHDDIIKSINKAIENIPVIPDLIEQIQEQITVAVFSILAPYVLPILKQVKSELQTGSSEVIQSSREQQHIVFTDDSCSNPTHSMLSKDHFSNVLNEPAGQIASKVVAWTVPQLMELWDNEEADIKRTMDRIVSGVFHHPALYQYGEDGSGEMRHIMFESVREWWNGKSQTEQDSLRDQLSREGVQEGRNHKEGVHDSGHGCGKPLTLHKGLSPSGQSSSQPFGGIEKVATEAAGGGGLGGLVGGLVSGVSSMLLNNSRNDSRRSEEASGSYGGWSVRQEYQERREPESSEHHSRESHHSRDRSNDSNDEHEGREHEHRHRKHHHGRERHHSHERSDDPDDSQTGRDHRRRDEYNQYDIESRRYTQEESVETYRPDRGEYEGEHTQTSYEYENRSSSYRHEERDDYENSRPFQESVPRYGNAPEGYGRGGYSARDEHGSHGQYGSRDEYGTEGGYDGGYGQNPQHGYGY